MTEEQAIIEITGAKQVACNCNACVNMCERTPCIGTPSDILNLIDAGHVDKVQPSNYLPGTKFGLPPIYMFAVKAKEDGSCVFLKDRKCTLHNTGLKPLEGKLAHHAHVTKEGHIPVSIAVATTWLRDSDFTVQSKIVHQYMKYNDER